MDQNNSHGVPALAGTVLTKKAIIKKADDVAADIVEHGNGLKIIEQIAALETFTKALRDNPKFLDHVRDELIKYGGTKELAGGAVAEITEAGVSYDYSMNAAWMELYNQEQAIAAKRKALEEKLRTIQNGKIHFDEQSGEVFQAPIKKSKSTYRLTLKK